MLDFLLRAYKLCLSPFLGERCRFHPSCSEYAVRALKTHGFFGGATLALWRLLRCNPWCQGGLDPVPDKIIGTRKNKRVEDGR
jgi:uncharacterized protein